MRETTLKLNDKTVIVHGGNSTLVQALAHFFCEQGSDVAIVGAGAGALRKFAESLSMNREVHAHYGRVGVFELPLVSSRDAGDAISRVAESFGSVDIFVEASLYEKSVAFSESNWLQDLSDSCGVNLFTPLLLAHSVLKFLVSRGKGRLLFLIKESSLLGSSGESLTAVAQSGIAGFVRSFSDEVHNLQITVNGVAVGLTEEHILARFPGLSIRDGLAQIKKSHPRADLVEPFDVAATVGFLASPLGQGISGQIIPVTKGV